MILLWIKSQDTFLSTEVKKFIETVTPDLTQIPSGADYSWIYRDTGIAWEKLEDVFDNIKEENGSKAWFFEAIKQVPPLFRECYHMLQNVYPAAYDALLKPFLEWTHQEKDIHLTIKQISKESTSGDHLVALLTITAIVERALGNVVLLKCKQVPFLLRDLLATPELEELIGKVKVQLLIVMLGSVLGLNLRNIAWHGFLSPHETSQAFVATIIFILADCGRMLEKTSQIKNIPCRPHVTFDEASCLSSVFDNMIIPRKAVLEEVIRNSSFVPIVMYPAWKKALELLEEEQWGLCVTLLLPLMECSMRAMFAHVNKVSERMLTAENSTLYTTMDEILNEYMENSTTSQTVNEKDGKYEISSCSACVHNLGNREHCEVNKCTLAADGIKHADQEKNRELDASEKKNQVQYTIGTKLNEALHDLLNFIQGPRIRDRVSHGEAKLQEIPEFITCHILYLNLLVLSPGGPDIDEAPSGTTNKMQCMNLRGLREEYALNAKLEGKFLENTSETKCLEHCPPPSDEACSQDKKCTNDSSNLSDHGKEVIGELRRNMNYYKCVFHPSAILHRRLIHAGSYISNWIQWDRVDSSELDYPEWESWDKIQLPEAISYPPLHISHNVCSLHNMEQFLVLVKNIQYKVLYRPKQEVELISILQRITVCILATLEKNCDNMTLKYSQYINKRLRSRQRETYRRQLIAVPVIVSSCYLTSQVIYLIFLAINKSGDLSLSSFTSLMRVLKPVLKVTENLVTQTSLSVNRWDEASSLSVNNIDHIRKEFTHRQE
ncbi:endoplasmic reticulum membrane-associated RNA degradation protein-like isoform X1 [Penaeus chinensis]|uniref:endoplasmic reticulum membrane-associated RNA degradation protein-like isoform X1 n=2 Tax=Penaeus chinensis TaxID=139456 RepID=UPI001FB5F063|nr:endoplasmic reticulum membrane-associated RNA degradation protein-like isoform X1 [Penaeus chinensis]XP_047484705.1 endoplasmic reticulum membrane-associated RNA degradation protein-like isoform X1 [Penaeus chinensis]